MFELKSGIQLQKGKYVIGNVLGKGRFGITYKATMTISVTGNLGGMPAELIWRNTLQTFFLPQWNLSRM